MRGNLLDIQGSETLSPMPNPVSNKSPVQHKLETTMIVVHSRHFSTGNGDFPLKAGKAT